MSELVDKKPEVPKPEVPEIKQGDQPGKGSGKQPGLEGGAPPRWSVEGRLNRVEQAEGPDAIKSQLARLPDRPGGEGKTTDIPVLEGKEYAPIVSGKDGPARNVPEGSRGFNGQALTHVEGHTAALMHQTGAKDGVLYINNEPCAGRPGCDKMLPLMLPPSAELRVIGPGGFDKLYVGKAD